MSVDKLNEVDTGKLHGLAEGGVIPGFAQGGYTGGPNWVPESGFPPRVHQGRSYSPPTVHVDYIAFLEQAKAQERWRTLREVLDKVEAINTRQPGASSWENKHRQGESVKSEAVDVIKALL